MKRNNKTTYSLSDYPIDVCLQVFSCPSFRNQRPSRTRKTHGDLIVIGDGKLRGDLSPSQPQMTCKISVADQRVRTSRRGTSRLQLCHCHPKQNAVDSCSWREERTCISSSIWDCNAGAWGVGERTRTRRSAGKRSGYLAAHAGLSHQDNTLSKGITTK